MTGGLLAEIAAIDRQLLEARPGEERMAAELLRLRGVAIAGLVCGRPSLEEIQRLRENSERIEEKLLHWRRTTIADLSAVEQHLRFLAETYGVDPRGPRMDVTV